jgi:dihydrodipicolinate synthase/N-acetylneuraminate lyase
MALDAIANGAHGCVPSLANLAPRFFADAVRRAAGGHPDPADQKRIESLMPAFGLLEERPQDSTTLRLMALKAILQVAGIMDPYMAQLAPDLTPEWRERARAFAEANELCRSFAGC